MNLKIEEKEGGHQMTFKGEPLGLNPSKEAMDALSMVEEEDIFELQVGVIRRVQTKT